MLVLNKMQRTCSAISQTAVQAIMAIVPKTNTDLTVLRMIEIKFVIFGRTILVIHSTHVCVLCVSDSLQPYRL